jgi:hypothetical protein
MSRGNQKISLMFFVKAGSHNLYQILANLGGIWSPEFGDGAKRRQISEDQCQIPAPARFRPVLPEFGSGRWH